MYSQSIHLDNLRLLIVDDDSDTRQILSLFFQLEGAEIISVASAREAIEIISIFKPDILISDISLPDEDGCSLLPKVRNLEALKGRWVPAIAVTGWVSAEDQENTMRAGFQKHLCKPINLDELLFAVASLVNLKQCINNFQIC